MERGAQVKDTQRTEKPEQSEMAYLFNLLHPSVLHQPSVNDILQYSAHRQSTVSTRTAHFTMQWNAAFGSKDYIGFVVCLTIFTDVLTYGVIVRTT